ANQRPPTASAAAEMAVPDRLDLTARVIVAEQALSASISGRLSIKSDSLRQMEARLQRSLPDMDSLRMRIDDLLRSAATHFRHNLEVKAERSGSLKSRLESLSPGDTLRRGYAIVQTSDGGEVVNDASQINVGDSLQITLSRGTIEAQTISVKAEDDDRAKP
ncbi:MAG: hypothetical protein IIC22_00605, partial [Chloroflexi bacterium]|nr:hypothetical protein [Chloroflexota bacterium]